MNDKDLNYILSLTDAIVSDSNKIGSMIEDDENIMALLNEIRECAESIANTV